MAKGAQVGHGALSLAKLTRIRVERERREIEHAMAGLAQPQVAPLPLQCVSGEKGDCDYYKKVSRGKKCTMCRERKPLTP